MQENKSNVTMRDGRRQTGVPYVQICTSAGLPLNAFNKEAEIIPANSAHIQFDDKDDLHVAAQKIAAVLFGFSGAYFPNILPSPSCSSASFTLFLVSAVIGMHNSPCSFPKSAGFLQLAYLLCLTNAVCGFVLGFKDSLYPIVLVLFPEVQCAPHDELLARLLFGVPGSI